MQSNRNIVFICIYIIVQSIVYVSCCEDKKTKINSFTYNYSVDYMSQFKDTYMERRGGNKDTIYLIGFSSFDNGSAKSFYNVRINRLTKQSSSVFYDKHDSVTVEKIIDDTCSLIELAKIFIDSEMYQLNIDSIGNIKIVFLENTDKYLYGFVNIIEKKRKSLFIEEHSGKNVFWKQLCNEWYELY